MAESQKAVFRVTIAAPIEHIFREITRTDRPLGAGAAHHRRGRDPRVRSAAPLRAYAPLHAVRRSRVQDRLRAHPEGPRGGSDLTVENPPVGTRTAKSMGFGGNFILANLKAIAERRRPAVSTRLMYAAMDALEFMLPARAKSERWPLERQPR